MQVLIALAAAVVSTGIVCWQWSEHHRFANELSEVERRIDQVERRAQT